MYKKKTKYTRRMCIVVVFAREYFVVLFTAAFTHTPTNKFYYVRDKHKARDGRRKPNKNHLTHCMCMCVCVFACAQFFRRRRCCYLFSFFFVEFSELIKIVVDCCLLLFCFVFIWISKSKWQNCIVRSSRLCVSCRDFHYCVLINHMHFILCTLNV